MIPLFAVHMPHAIDKPLLETLHSGYIGQGPRVDDFEKELGKFFGFKNIVTTCSGTAGLQLAFRILRIGQVNGGSADDEVITTPMTCTATNMPIIASGAKIEWADVDPDTGLIDELDVERKITAKTRAIVCVHWGGTPCDMATLRAIARQYNIALIEDAAHAFGATEIDSDNKIGCQSADITMFSFQAIKHITTVDGGALSISDTDLYRRARLERWYGIDRDSDRKDMRCEEDVENWGLKWHMNDISAVIGLEQLKYANGIIKEHRNNASIYWNLIDRDRFVPAFPKEALVYSSFWLYTILLSNNQDRLWFMEHMRKHGIHVSQVHARNDTHTVFRKFAKGRLPGVDKFVEKMVCIPVHWALKEFEVEKIVDACKTYKVLDSVGL